MPLAPFVVGLALVAVLPGPPDPPTEPCRPTCLENASAHVRLDAPPDPPTQPCRPACALSAREAAS